MLDRPVPAARAFSGEIGTAGEAVGRTEERLQEAAKLGFERVDVAAVAADRQARRARAYAFRKSGD